MYVVLVRVEYTTYSVLENVPRSLLDEVQSSWRRHGIARAAACCGPARPLRPEASPPGRPARTREAPAQAASKQYSVCIPSLYECSTVSGNLPHNRKRYHRNGFHSSGCTNGSGIRIRGMYNDV